MKYWRNVFRRNVKQLFREPDPYADFHYERALPDKKKVMVLAAHADDETLGCGGTLVLHKRQGAVITVVVLTDGAGLNVKAEDIKGQRKAEAREVSGILGIDDLNFLDVPDTKLKDHMSFALPKVMELVGRFKPDLIYAPSPIDFHPDHRGAFRIACEVLKKGVPVSFYEIYAPIRFNRLIDITEVRATKEKAMMAYRVSLLGIQGHFIDAMRGLGSYRGFFEGRDGLGRSYEAFWLLESPVGKNEMVRWLTYDL
jgi:LmbE family N-acetylglucosaminyl deacetylase